MAEINGFYINTNDWVLKEFMQITGTDENEAKVFVKINNLKKVLNRSTDALLIEQYLNNSQTDGQKQKDLKIRNIYSNRREDQEKVFIESGFDKQRRLLLWHGTKRKNLRGILTNGFRLPIKDNLQFGKGIYFADRVSESLRYCDQTGSGCLLLCEVSIGDMFKTLVPKPYTAVPDNYHSIQAIGKYIPEPNVQTIINGSIEVPIGKTVENNESNIALTEILVNEYIIFDPKRVVIKFIVHFDWSQI